MRIPALILAVTTLMLLAACGEPDQGRSRLKLDSQPGSEVWLDGEHRGATPLDLKIEPGEYRVVFKREGFVDHENTLPVPAGSEVELSAALIAADTDSEAVLAAIAMAEGIEREPLPGEIPVHRGGSRAGVVLYWPQGEVRLASVGTYRIDVDVAYEGDGFLEFRKGRKVLSREPFDPEEMVTVGEIPAAVMDALKPNSVITWGIFYEGGRRTPKPTACKFKTVRKARVVKAMAKLEKSRNFQRQPEIIQEIMRADILRNNQLHSEALVQYLAIAGEWPDSTLPFKGIAASAQRLKLKETPMYAEAASLGATKGRGSGGALPNSLSAPTLGALRTGVSPGGTKELLFKLKKISAALDAWFAAPDREPPAAMAKLQEIVVTGKIPGRRSERNRLINLLGALAEAVGDEDPLGERVRALIGELK